MSSPATIPTHNQVTRDNLGEVQPRVAELLKQATFIALDVEFTGFGNNLNATKARNLQERYENLCAVAKSHALIAFGLSIFINKSHQLDSQQQSTASSSQGSTKQADQKNKDDGHILGKDLIAHGDRGLERAFIVHNFNFSMLKSHDFSVTPNSMRFLAETGVDLNQWVKEGISYTDGDDTESSGKDDPNAIMRSIFKRIMTCHVPVVVHNGLLDLIFLYQSFYLTLPTKLSMFTADLSDMFPRGIYDTKYVSDYITRERVSFLSYLFRKYERADTRTRLKLASMIKESTDTHAENQDHAEQEGDQEAASHSEETEKKTSRKPLVFSTFDIQERLPLHKRARQEKRGDVEICESFALHGNCRNGVRCEKTHDLDAILDHEENKRKKQKNGSAKDEKHKASDNKTTQQESTPPPTLPITAPTVTVPVSSSGTAPLTEERSTIENSALTPEKFHSAYFDAYMTGTVFSHQLNKHTDAAIETQARNRIYLIGKSVPLVAEKSSFAQYSPGHLQKSRGGRTL